METTLAEIPFEQLARLLKLSPVQIQNAVTLLDEGWSIPFLAQYRLDHTDGASERVLSRLARELADIRQMQQRKSSLVEYLSARGDLPPEMELEIQSADSREKIEHLHAIFKRNRQPKAMVQRNQAIEPLVNQVLDGSISAEELASETSQVAAASALFDNAEDVAAAVRELMVIRFSQSLPVRQMTLEIIRATGAFNCRRYQAGDDGALAEPAANQASSQKASSEKVSSQKASSEEEAPRGVSTAETTTDADRASGAETADTAAAAAAPDQAPVTETTPAKCAPKPAGPVLSLAEQRRQRRKESRLRRRAHLEATLKSYFGSRFPLAKLTPSQYADIDFGERVRVLTAVFEFDRQKLETEASKLVVSDDSQHALLIGEAWKEALDRFVVPDCERIIRRHFASEVEQQGVTSIKRRVRNICMQRPIYQPILSVVGNRDGFSLAVIDAEGTTLHSEDLLRNDYGPDKIKQRIGELVEQHSVAVVAIAEGPRTRLIEQLASDSLGNELKAKGVGWFIVASDGLENFCKTAVGCEEIPNVPPEQRVAIALGRRTQNPLFEFVKCAPRDWLTEKQQTIVDIKRLSEDVLRVYQSCLARVGVDVNRASAAVLSKIPGIDESTAHKMEASRKTRGRSASLTQFPELEELPPQRHSELCGFLRITDGDCPFDALGIHPDHHEAATKVLKRCEFTVEMLAERVLAQREATAGRSEASAKEAAAEWTKALRAVNLGELSGQVGVGKEQLKRIVNELCFAGRDIRMNSLLPIIRDGGFKMADLKPGDHFAGRVVSVASFGAFVEISQGVTGLLHISRLGDRFVRDPRELVMPGETIPVWIVSVDREKQRIALSISPPRESKPHSEKPASRGPRTPRKTGGRTDNRRSQKTEFKPRTPRRPKRVVPISEEMKSGDAPLRTFGDLKQFFELAKDPAATEEKPPAKSSKKASTKSSTKSPEQAPEQSPEQSPATIATTPPAATPPAATPPDNELEATFQESSSSELDGSGSREPPAGSASGEGEGESNRGSN